MMGTGLQLFPIERNVVCREGRPGLCCLQSLETSFEAAVSTANHFQMGLWRFMS